MLDDLRWGLGNGLMLDWECIGGIVEGLRGVEYVELGVLGGLMGRAVGQVVAGRGQAGGARRTRGF
jgi:hypothetical protein